jgi:hypothetical protein
MINNGQQEFFWEVALTNDRDAFIRGKRNEYFKGHSKPVRLDRSAKSSIVATATVARKGASVAYARARAANWS